MDNDRWHPARAGVVNVWRYLEETFEFHRGRVLLRGPNGSGKSMALELLFPFLLDANAQPGRLSSSTKSRGGLLERLVTGAEHPSRAGFLWAEFCRGDRTFTIGARLRASQNTRKVDLHWFTTSQSVGRTLQLLDDTRGPLSRATLADALGEHGTLYDSREAYKDVVRTTLFPGFSTAQYEAMISALLALRREKISQDLTPTRLSEILTGSLPPLNDHDITEVAEGFEKLDKRKDNIARLESDLALVRKLASRQQAYARIILAAQAAETRNAETRRDDVTRNERAAKTALVEARQRRTDLDTEREAAEGGARDRTSRIQAMRATEAYKQGGQLEQLRNEHRRLRRASERARDNVEERDRERAEADMALQGSIEQHAQAKANAEKARIDADAAGDAIGAKTLVTEAAESNVDGAQGLRDAWIQSRESQLRDVQRALRTLADRIAERNLWEQQAEADAEAVDGRRGELAEANARFEDKRDKYRDDIADWRGACTVLTGLEALPNEPVDAAGAAGARAAEIGSELAVQRDRIQASVNEVQEERQSLVEEREVLASGRTPEPPAPSWRSLRDRAGAPLWRLVDFADDLSSQVKDRIEAALHASGLLDAWIAADGRVSLPSSVADAIVDTAWPPAAGPTLADVLVALDVDVPSHVIQRALATIALRDEAVATTEQVVVGRDGSFRLGTLAGRGSIKPASFIGAAAQERQRAERIAQIDEELARLGSTLTALARQLDHVERTEAAVAAELAALPDGAEVIDAIRAVERAEDRAADADARLAHSRSELEVAGKAVRSAQAELMRIGSTHALPTTEDNLETYREGLTAFRSASDVWLRRRRDTERAHEAMSVARTTLDKRIDTHQNATRAAAEAKRDEHDVASRLQALEVNVGSDYKTVLDQIEAAEHDLSGLRQRAEALVTELRTLENTIGKLQRDVEDAESKRAEADEHRQRSHARFLAAIADALPGDAAIEQEIGQPDGMTAVLDTARSVAQELTDTATDDRARETARESLSETLHTTKQSLGGHVDFTFDQTEHGWWLLRASTDGIRRSVHQLRSALAAELDAARAELREDEQRLFDETLTGSVRQAVADRIRRSTELVSQINQQLVAVRTAAAGVQVKLRWEVDPEQPDAVRSARALLLKDPADLNEAEREALYGFFRARLDQVRADLDGSAGWETRLREVLDYRHWHRFALDVAHRDWDGFVNATTSRLQRLSTGERSMALHLPMLASITAHYGGTAGAICPRLILLDELFAGVDTANRGQLFGMLVAWDLDAVLTSDHEWCAYATLDGIAIHHLHPAEGDDPVTSTRFVWNGQRRVAAPVA